FNVTPCSRRRATFTTSSRNSLGNGFGTGHILPAAPLGTTDQMSPIRAADPIDLRHLMTGTYIERLTIHHATEAIRDVRAEMKKWTDGIRGLSVVTRDGDEKDRRDRERYQQNQERIKRQRAEREAAQNAPEEAEGRAGDEPSPGENDGK
ncbi:hypothetical protein, partial [Marmoricola sp. RAF53]|uniref:hypothetical protein n=1 Tax=Marmoricola sp. RAF53 TaxID=3233059 RepID=UPI003F956979